MNTFGSLAIAAMLIVGGAGVAGATTSWKVGGDASSSSTLDGGNAIAGGAAGAGVAGNNGEAGGAGGGQGGGTGGTPGGNGQDGQDGLDGNGGLDGSAGKAGADSTASSTPGHKEDDSNRTVTGSAGDNLVVGGAGSTGGNGGNGADGGDGAEGGAGGNGGNGGNFDTISAGGKGGAGGTGGDGGTGAVGEKGGNAAAGAAGGVGTAANTTLNGTFDSVTVGGAGAAAGAAGTGGAGGAGGAKGDNGKPGTPSLIPIPGAPGLGGDGGAGGDGSEGGAGGNANNGGDGGQGSLTITGGSANLGSFVIGNNGALSTAGANGGNAPSSSLTGGKDGNGGNGGNGAQGGAGGEGDVTISGGNFTAATISVGGSGTAGGKGGTGGDASVTSISFGGDGGKGGDGANGGNGTLTLSGNSSLHATGDLKLGGVGGAGGAGGDGGKTIVAIPGNWNGPTGAGGDAGAAGAAGTASLTITDSASLYVDGTSSIGGQGGMGGAGGNVNESILAVGIVGKAGAVGQKGGDSTFTMNGGSFGTTILNIGGNGGEGGKGGDAKVVGGIATTGGAGANGATGGTGSFELNAGTLFVENGLQIGGNAANGGASGEVSGNGVAGAGGIGGAGGVGSMTLNGGSGFLSAVQLGGDGATNSTDAVIDGIGKGTLTLNGGNFSATSIQLGGTGGDKSGTLNGSKGGTGYLLMTGGTLSVSGDTQLGGYAGAGADSNSGWSGGGDFVVNGGTYATKTFTTTQALVGNIANSSLTVSNVAGEAKAVLIVGTDDVNFLRNSPAVDVMEGVNGAKYTGVLGLTAANTDATFAGTTLDLGQVTNWGLGGAATTGGTVYGTSLTVVDAKSYVDRPGSVALNVGAGKVEAGASLMLIGDNQLRAGDTFNVMQGTDLATNGTWAQENLISSSRLLVANMALTDGAGNDGSTHNQITMDAADATRTMYGTSRSTANMLAEMARVEGVHTDSAHAGVRYFSRASDMRFIATGEESARVIASALQVASAAGVQTSTLSTVTAGNNALLSRTSTRSSISTPRATALSMGENGQVSLDAGLNAGDGFKNGFGVWINPLYQSESTYNQKSEGYKTGVNSNLAGLAVGADYSFMEMFRTGIALMLGGGFAQSSGDYLSSKNNFNFWGITAYGAMDYNNFGLVADIGYTSAFNKVSQDTPDNMFMGELKADMFSSALSAGLRGDYRFETSALDIIPHVGVRFTSLITDKHSVKGDGGTLLDVEQMNQNIWTFPIGVAFEKQFESTSGWMFTPKVDLGVVFAAGDLDVKTKSRMPGFATQASNTTAVVDGTTFDGALGFEVKKNDFSVGINYNLQLSEHRTGHGVNVMLGYEF